MKFKVDDVVVRTIKFKSRATKKALILEIRGDIYYLRCLIGTYENEEYELRISIIDSEFELCKETVWNNEMKELLNV